MINLGLQANLPGANELKHQVLNEFWCTAKRILTEQISMKFESKYKSFF